MVIGLALDVHVQGTGMISGSDLVIIVSCKTGSMRNKVLLAVLFVLVQQDHETTNWYRIKMKGPLQSIQHLSWIKPSPIKKCNWFKSMVMNENGSCIFNEILIMYIL